MARYSNIDSYPKWMIMFMVVFMALCHALVGTGYPFITSPENCRDLHIAYRALRLTAEPIVIGSILLTSLEDQRRRELGKTTPCLIIGDYYFALDEGFSMDSK